MANIRSLTRRVFRSEFDCKNLRAMNDQLAFVYSHVHGPLVEIIAELIYKRVPDQLEFICGKLDRYERPRKEVVVPSDSTESPHNSQDLDLTIDSLPVMSALQQNSIRRALMDLQRNSCESQIEQLAKWFEIESSKFVNDS